MKVMHCSKGFYVGCYDSKGRAVKVSKNFYKTSNEAEKVLGIFKSKY